MSLLLYSDVHVRFAIVSALRARGVDIITAQQDKAAGLDDPFLLDRANALGRVLFTQDEDFLREAAHRQRAGVSFNGIIYAHQLRVGIGQVIEDLEFISKIADPIEVANCVIHLPILQSRLDGSQSP